MLDNFNGSPDVAFARDIHAIAKNTEHIASALAMIAGILAKREGIPCASVLQDNKPNQPSKTQPPANHDPLTPTDNQPLQDAIQNAYELWLFLRKCG